MNGLGNTYALSGGETLSVQLFCQLGIVEQQLTPGDHETANHDKDGHRPDHDRIIVSES
jgi:hypothetical protein